MHRIIARQWRESEEFLEDGIRQAADHLAVTRPGATQVMLEEQMDLLSTRMQVSKAAWEAYKDHPTVQRMARLVARYVDNFAHDFYTVDLPMLADGPDRSFIWAVRPTGTLLVWASYTDPQGQAVSQVELAYYQRYDTQERPQKWYRGSLDKGIRRVPNPQALRIEPVEEAL